MIIRATREDFSRHHFNRDLARKIAQVKCTFDLAGAILLTDIARNVVGISKYRNKLQEWYYTTLDDLCKRHPYLSRSTINRTLKKLREDRVLLTTDEHNRRRYDRTLWYSIPDPETLRLASGDEGNISFIVNDAVKYGLEPAILLSNVKYWTIYNMADDPMYLYEYQPLSPSELSDHSLVNLPMNAWTIRRALNVLVDEGALERKRNNQKSNACFLYRVVEDGRPLVPPPDADYPTECTPHQE